MSGRIIGISGPTVSVDLAGLKLYERVVVGAAGLMGEVVRLEHPVPREPVVLASRIDLDGAAADLVHARPLLDGTHACALEERVVDGEGDVGHGGDPDFPFNT